jgi:hypothetical protein
MDRREMDGLDIDKICEIEDFYKQKGMQENTERQFCNSLY